jgi:hypothetical protein
MKIVLNSWFQLPWVGRDVFSSLMRAKVENDKKFGFRFTSETNIPRALSILSSTLEEPVELARSCFICDNPLEGSVDSSLDQEGSICKDCESSPDSYDIYVMKFAKLMETV